MMKVLREDEQWENGKENGTKQVLKTCQFRHSVTWIGGICRILSIKSLE
jgi:hypothetical protein